MQLTEDRMTFSSYEEYKKFASAFGSDRDIDFDEALYQALINNDLTPKEAKNFLIDELTADYLTEVRLYKNKVVFQFEGVEFSDGDIEENYDGGFTIAFHFDERQWHWIEMF